MALPVVAPPIPINIGHNQSYLYVVAHTGGTTVTASATTGLNVSVIGNRTLQISAQQTLQTTGTITVNVTGPGGTVTQSIPVSIFLENADPFNQSAYPNITSVPTSTAGINAAVNYRIAATGATTFGALGLPSGMTVNKTTGAITGTPPAGNATYADTLIATTAAGSNGSPGHSYYRYWQLQVGAGGNLSVNGSSGAGSGGSFSLTGAATTFTYTGVSLSTPSLAGGPTFERPFAADPTLYLYHVQYKVAMANFTPLAWDASGPYGGLHVGESNFKNERGGILTFWRTFTLVPSPRDEYESFVYGFQWGAGSTIGEIPTLVHSRVHYDYFNTTSPDTTITLARAPRIGFILGFVYQVGNYMGLLPGDEFLAENATYRHWMGNIYERKQRFIKMESIGEQVAADAPGGPALPPSA